MFTDRKDAGKKLADRLLQHPAIMQAEKTDLLVLSIPRGGVVVGDAVAQALGCRHNVLVVKKIGYPGYEELAVGALAENEQIFLNNRTMREYGLKMVDVKPVIDRTRGKVTANIHLFRHNQPLDVTDKIVILIDDGIATGETMKAAIQWVRSQHTARKVMLAVPVCARQTAYELVGMADELVCLSIPDSFMAVGQFYWQFTQVSDEEVLDILHSRETSGGLT